MKRILCLAFALLIALAPAGRAEGIKVGISKLLGYPGVPIAIARGYFKAEGIDAEMVYFDSAQPIAVAVASGGVDFGVSGMSASFYNARGAGPAAPHRLVGRRSAGLLQPHASSPRTRPMTAGLTSPKELAGHSVAITQVGTSLHYSIGRAAEKFGFPMSAVDGEAAAIQHQRHRGADRRHGRRRGDAELAGAARARQGRDQAASAGSARWRRILDRQRLLHLDQDRQRAAAIW